MKPAWESYIRKILWRYPQNHPIENAAIEKAMKSGVPEEVRLIFFEKRIRGDAADAQQFLAKVAKNLGLPTE